MRYRVRHVTAYSYADDVASAHHVLHLQLRPDPRQVVHAHALTVTPTPTWSSDFVDAFGNPSRSVSVEGPHALFEVTAEHEVTVRAPQPVDLDRTPPWERVRERLAEPRDASARASCEFALPSPVFADVAPFRELAERCFTPGRPIGRAAFDLTRAIHAHFVYDPQATNVTTPPQVALERRRGVCQDFAHVMIGALRSIGLAGRYVSGYLRTRPPPGKPRLVGADASHAWVAVWCGEAGWVEFDPTNDRLVGSEHVTAAWGRDYQDVSPVRGVILGGGTHGLSVSVDVEPLNP